jgi:hypothetical protein
MPDSIFADPGPRQWDEEGIAILLRVDRANPKRVHVGKVTQIIKDPEHEVKLDRASQELLNFYLAQKLRAVGVWVDKNAEYQVNIQVRGFYRASPPLLPPYYQIHLFWFIQDAQFNTLGEEHEIEYRWTPGPINGTAAEVLTMMLADEMGQVLADLSVVVEEAVGED